MVYVEIFVTVNYGAGQGGRKHSKPESAWPIYTYIPETVDT